MNWRPGAARWGIGGWCGEACNPHERGAKETLVCRFGAYTSPVFSALIIDFEHPPKEEIQGVLGPYGFEFISTRDADEAMVLVRTETPDIILARVELPRVSGFSLCNRLRRDDLAKYIPVVLYSTMVSDDVFNQHRNLDTSADEYLRFPFAPDRLLSAVRKLLPLGESDENL